MQQDSMIAVDPRILRELRPGEQLLWWGRPDPAYMSQRHIPRLIFRNFLFLSSFCMVLLLLDMVFVIFSIPPTIVTQLNLLGLIFFLSLFLLFFIRQTINARVMYGQVRTQLKGLGQTVYAITNQRIVEVFGNEALRVFSYSRTDIDKIARIETREGRGDLIYATPALAISPLISLTSRRMVGIPDVRAVQELVLRTFKDEIPSIRI